MSDPRVLIVDDHDLVRHGLGYVVKECFPDAEVLEAPDADAAMAVLGSEPIDIALFDIKMPGRDGLELLREAKAARPELPVIMLSTFDDARYAKRALADGAAGYMLKDSTPSDLGQAMKVALAGGGNVMSSRIVQNLFSESQPQESRAAEGNGDRPAPHLTNRESDILELLVEGLSNHEISERLYLSEKTVKAHLASVFRKLGVSNRTQAAMAAVAMGVGQTAR
jgi:DNA-binding NarL/FixJ family response regulator